MEIYFSPLDVNLHNIFLIGNGATYPYISALQETSQMRV